MKRIAFVISLLTMSCTIVRAQQDYFIFISSENTQPFYIRLNEHTYSSSAIGHLVIPRLRDTTYTLEVGFPKKQYPERTFVVSLDKKDLDYQLKNTGKEGWVLFNAQTSETVKPRQEQVKNTDLSLGERKTGAFATLMSALVNDSAVLYKSIAKVDATVKPATTVVKTDTQAVVIAEKEAAPARTVAVITPASPVDSVQTEKNTIPVKIDTPIALSTVIPVQEWGNDKGKGYIYYDSTSVGMDTISLMIEFEKGAPLSLPTPQQVIAAPARIDTVKAVITPDTPATVAQKQPVQAAKDSTEKTTATIAQDIPANNTAEKTAPVTIPDTSAKDATKQVVANTVPDSPAIEKEPVKVTPPVVITVDTARKEPIAKVQPDTPAVTTVVKTDTAVAAKTSYAPSKNDSAATVEASKKPLLLMNSDCVNFASEYDVDKLRVKMLSANSVDDKVAAAKKVFKTKCFVTRYIRGLSELFPNDEARFKFFDAAYPFVSDTGNFRQLLDLFTDELYIARFKALVRM